MPTFYFFVEAETEDAALEQARRHAREVVNCEDFDGIHPLARPPENVVAFTERLEQNEDATVEWYADPVSDVDGAYLVDVFAAAAIKDRFYDLRGGDCVRVADSAHAEELRSLDAGDVYFVPVGVERG